MSKETGYKCKVKVHLVDQEITQGDFAKILGISNGTLSLILNNKQLPSFETTYKICEYFDKKMNELWVKIENI